MKKIILTSKSILNALMERGLSSRAISFHIDLLYVLKERDSEVKITQEFLSKKMNLSRTIVKNRLSELIEKGALKADPKNQTMQILGAGMV